MTDTDSTGTAEDWEAVAQVMDRIRGASGQLRRLSGATDTGPP